MIKFLEILTGGNSFKENSVFVTEIATFWGASLNFGEHALTYAKNVHLQKKGRRVWEKTPKGVHQEGGSFVYFSKNSQKSTKNYIFQKKWRHFYEKKRRAYTMKVENSYIYIMARAPHVFISKWGSIKRGTRRISLLQGREPLPARYAWRAWWTYS